MLDKGKQKQTQPYPDETPPLLGSPNSKTLETYSARNSPVQLAQDEHRAGPSTETRLGRQHGETQEGEEEQASDDTAMDAGEDIPGSESTGRDMKGSPPNTDEQRSSRVDDPNGPLLQSISPPDPHQHPVCPSPSSSSSVNLPQNPSSPRSSRSHNPSSTGSSTRSAQPPTTMIPDDFLPLLHCPLCRPSALLQNPITLRCGHTVCGRHLVQSPDSSTSPFSLASLIPSTSQRTPPPCPIPTCQSLNPSTRSLALHPNARVNFIPPPASVFHIDQDDEGLLHSRSDVSVNKIISLLLRSESSFPSGDRSTGDDDDDETEAEDDGAPEPSVEEESDLDDEGSTVTNNHTDRSRSRATSFSAPRTSNSAPTFRSSADPAPSASGHRPRRSREHFSHSPSPEPPRKRLRRTPRRHPHNVHAPVQLRHHRSRVANPGSDDGMAPSVRLEKELMAELQCQICFALMWQPVTTPCQHTFCAKCLFRSLDHNPSCPLCRQSLPRFTLLQDQPCNKVILAIILKAFPDTYTARGAAIEEEEHQEGLDTPVFVCQLSFPGMPVFLNFYEPRFKLMLRRCLETEYPCFGMIPLPNQSAPSYRSPSQISRTSPTHEYGTMLEIRKVQMLQDGQCLVEAWGTHRFRILKKGELDGYCIAKVEQVDDLEGMEEDEVMALDTMVSSNLNQDETALTSAGSLSLSAGPSTTLTSSLEPSATRASSNVQTATSGGGPPIPPPRTSPHAPTNEDLMRVCNDFLAQLESGTPWVIERLNEMYVPKPRDPAMFSFWMALILPVDEHEKAKLLPIRSPRLRLRLIVHWIQQLNAQWWFNGGCVIS